MSDTLDWFCITINHFLPKKSLNNSDVASQTWRWLIGWLSSKERSANTAHELTHESTYGTDQFPRSGCPGIINAPARLMNIGTRLRSPSRPLPSLVVLYEHTTPVTQEVRSTRISHQGRASLTSLSRDVLFREVGPINVCRQIADCCRRLCTHQTAAGVRAVSAREGFLFCVCALMSNHASWSGYFVFAHGTFQFLMRWWMTFPVSEKIIGYN